MGNDAIDTTVEREIETFDYIPNEYVAPMRYSLDDAIANGDAYISPNGAIWF